LELLIKLRYSVAFEIYFLLSFYKGYATLLLGKDYFRFYKCHSCYYLESNSNSTNEDKITLFLNSDTNEKLKEGVEISSQLLKMALKVVKELVEEKETLIFTEDKELTTQEAADYLNVSRPYLIKLIEEGKIPFRKVGTHRRIKFAELIKYDNLVQEQQLKGLAELTKQAQELNLGYE